MHRRLVEREPVQRNDFFPGQLVGGTPAYVGNIKRGVGRPLRYGAESAECSPRAAQPGRQYQALEAVAQYPTVIAGLPSTRAAASSASSEKSQVTRAWSILSRSAAFSFMATSEDSEPPTFVSPGTLLHYDLRHTSSRATMAALRYWQRSAAHQRASIALLPIVCGGHPRNRRT
jgi:hypothetical protein